jgi:hypothetical protein
VIRDIWTGHKDVVIAVGALGVVAILTASPSARGHVGRRRPGKRDAECNGDGFPISFSDGLSDAVKLADTNPRPRADTTAGGPGLRRP